MSQHKVILTTGGTGGHVFPAIATARHLTEMGCEVLFITDSRGEKYFADHPFKYKVVNCASPSGNLIQKIKFAFKSGIGLLQSLAIFAKFKPQAAVGFGGYPSFPAIIAAKMTGKKIILHEQNSVLGKANAFLLRYADKLATSFAKTRYAEGNNYVGNPVRKKIAAYPYPQKGEKLNIFITGGSQGALSFGEYFPDAFEGIENIKITQQISKENKEAVELKYLMMGIENETSTFFDDIEKKIEEAHLVICRSGSSTIAEISVIGRPAIFIPLPSSADNHQVLNAMQVAETGGAWVVEEKDIKISELNKLLKEILADYDKLAEASEKMKEFAKPDAANSLAKLIVDAMV